MIAKDLLQILCCPETKEEVTEATHELIETLNRLIAGHALKNRAGVLIKEPLDAGLLRKDGRFLYPVRQDIPVMLIDEAIPLDGLQL